MVKVSPLIYFIYAKTKAVINTLSLREDIHRVIPTWETIQNLIKTGRRYNDDEVKSPEKKQSDKDVDAITESFRVAYSNRRLFRTGRNYIGIAADSLQRGDALWIIAGAAAVPLVMRRLPGGNWRLVGEAYMHGLMSGEAVRDRLGR